MKKYAVSVILLSLILLLFASCTSFKDNPGVTESSGSTDIPTESLGTKDDSLPYIERYGFFSFDDFRLFCRTGSKDASLYNAPPQDGVFPPFEMNERSFVDISELFPSLDMDQITIDYIEIVNNHNYIYSGYTNEKRTPFSIIINYNENFKEMSPEMYVSTINTSIYNEIVYQDYCMADVETPRSSVLYVCELNDSILCYGVYKTNIQGMSVTSGEYTVGISPRYSTNTDFFTDETLEPLSCLFRDGAARIEALSHIAQLNVSKQ